MNMRTINKFKRADTSNLPGFHSLDTVSEKGMWILYVGKEILDIKRLTAQDIADIALNAFEEKIKPKSLTLSFNRVSDKVNAIRENGLVYFEILRKGKDHLQDLKAKETTVVKPDTTTPRVNGIEIFQFGPDKPFSSKKGLINNVLEKLTGEIRIIDPYPGEQTLDVLEKATKKNVRFLTCLAKIQKDAKKEAFQRYLKDFLREFNNIEFRDYPYRDIHDRYIISGNFLVILGHSIKDFGKKDTLAILVEKDLVKDFINSLSSSFEERWKKANPIG